jgi:dynein heavy chain
MWKLSYKLSKQFNSPDCKGPLKVAVTVKSRIEKFKIFIPLIQVICNPGLKSRHWDSICRILNADIRPNDDTTLKDILKNDEIIEKNLTELSEISELASKEYTLEQALKKMKNDWESVNFLFILYKDTNIHILVSYEEILALLEDQIVKTSTIKNSPFVKSFETDANSWFSKMVIFCSFISRKF